MCKSYFEKFLKKHLRMRNNDLEVEAW